MLGVWEMASNVFLAGRGHLPGLEAAKDPECLRCLCPTPWPSAADHPHQPGTAANSWRKAGWEPGLHAPRGYGHRQHDLLNITFPFGEGKRGNLRVYVLIIIHCLHYNPHSLLTAVRLAVSRLTSEVGRRDISWFSLAERTFLFILRLICYKKNTINKLSLIMGHLQSLSLKRKENSLTDSLPKMRRVSFLKQTGHSQQVTCCRNALKTLAEEIAFCSFLTSRRVCRLAAPFLSRDLVDNKVSRGSALTLW